MSHKQTRAYVDSIFLDEESPHRQGQRYSKISSKKYTWVYVLNLAIGSNLNVYLKFDTRIVNFVT